MKKGWNFYTEIFERNSMQYFWKCKFPNSNMLPAILTDDALAYR